MNSVNLLPTARKRVILINRYAGKSRLLLTLLTLALAGIVAYSVITRMTIERSFAQLEREAQRPSPEAARYDQVAAQAKELAKKVQEYYTLVNEERDFGNLFEYLQAALPPNAHLTSITTSASGSVMVVSLAGSASDQKAVGVYREKLLFTQESRPELRISVSDVTIDSITNTATDVAAQTFTMRATVAINPLTTKNEP